MGDTVAQERGVKLEVTNGVATITLCRPPGNALTKEGMDLLREVLPVLASDPAVRVFVLAAEGKFYCTGMNLSANSQKSVRADPSATNTFN